MMFSPHVVQRSPRAQRTAVMATKLADLSDFVLAIDCLASGCGGERAYLIDELARFYGAQMTVGQTLRRMRCQNCLQRPPRAAWPLTGPMLNKRVKARRVPLLGDEAKG
jgi:hypothetical protein